MLALNISKYNNNTLMSVLFCIRLLSIFNVLNGKLNWKYAVVQCNGFINDKTIRITLFLVSLPFYKKREIVSKKTWSGKGLSHPLRITGLILLSANLSNWEAKKLFEWDYLRKPIFLGIFVNHFKLHNNKMISLTFNFITALL